MALVCQAPMVRNSIGTTCIYPPVVKCGTGTFLDSSTNSCVVSSSCMTYQQYQDSNPLQLSVSEAHQIGTAIFAAWAVAFGLRELAKFIKQRHFSQSLE